MLFILASSSDYCSVFMMYTDVKDWGGAIQLYCQDFGKGGTHNSAKAVLLINKISWTSVCVYMKILYELSRIAYVNYIFNLNIF